MKLRLKEMLSESSNISHKRVISLLSFIVLFILVVASLWGLQINDKILYVFASLTGGQSLLSVVEKFKNEKRN